MTSDCGPNEIYNACADPCQDVSSCSDPLLKICPESPITIATCVCKPGYKMSAGECIEEISCPVPEGKPSEWSEWSKCTPNDGLVNYHIEMIGDFCRN